MSIVFLCPTGFGKEPSHVRSAGRGGSPEGADQRAGGEKFSAWKGELSTKESCQPRADEEVSIQTSFRWDDFKPRFYTCNPTTHSRICSLSGSVFGVDRATELFLIVSSIMRKKCNFFPPSLKCHLGLEGRWIAYTGTMDVPGLELASSQVFSAREGWEKPFVDSLWRVPVRQSLSAMEPAFLGLRRLLQSQGRSCWRSPQTASERIL